MRFRDRLARFFWGRNGADGLYYGLFVLYLLIWVLQLIFRDSRSLTAVFGVLSTAVLVIMIYRAFSKNLYKRRRENQIFMSFIYKIKGFFVLQKNKIRDRKDFVYKKCPSCKATLRLPRRKGEHTVKCPKCGNRFGVKV